MTTQPASSTPDPFRQLWSGVSPQARVLYTGLPTVRDERWRWTNLAFLDKLEFSSPPAVSPDWQEQIKNRLLPGPGHRVLVLNGQLQGSLPQIPGVRWSSADALSGTVVPAAQSSLTALNAALSGKSLVLHLDGTVDSPLQLVFVTCATDAPAAIFPRVLVVAAEGAAATVIEHHIG
ncbi:MAG: hypothetical protein M3O22_08770, partial [Pseudomonadota bacterium]|nr:hypothetical protein [Pseudomonadota bacterium]